MTSPQAAVLTAIYGAYDTLKPVKQQSVETDWVLVTDDASLRSWALGWRVVYRPMPGIHPNRAAKVPKLFPWEFTEAPASVWLDASFRVTSPDFVREALSFADPIAQFTHPWRDCVFDEAQECIAIARHKYAPEVLAVQADAYRAAGHPEHWGLWATGIIARKHADERVKRLGERWAQEIAVYSFQDQVSHPVVMREVGLRPASFPGTHFANPWLMYEGSENH